MQRAYRTFVISRCNKRRLTRLLPDNKKPVLVIKEQEARVALVVRSLNSTAKRLFGKQSDHYFEYRASHTSRYV